MSITEDAPATLCPPAQNGMAAPAPAAAANNPLIAELCVLASGSSGNCSILSLRRGSTGGGVGGRRLCLIDLGLSPRRTVKLLARLGLGLHNIDDVVLTHLDTDHFRPTWLKALPPHVRVHLHESHARRSDHFGLFSRVHASPFCDGFSLRDGTPVRTVLASHDNAGVTTLRFCLEIGCFGFATDVGRMTTRLIDHLAGVDVLAIESNYCPVMQENSGRPISLKRRIMGGSGHLSNHEAVDAIGAIRPRHVILLHLSRQCNDPALVTSLHDGCQYGLTITSQFEPTGWVRIGHRNAVDHTSAADPTSVADPTSRAAPASGLVTVVHESQTRPPRTATAT